MALAIAAGSAHGAFFSFASDNDHTSWTFAGTAGSGGTSSLNDANDSTDVVDLQIDDNNGPLGQLNITVDFRADFELTHQSSVNIFGSLWQHSYSVSGGFAFTNPLTGEDWLVSAIVPPSEGVFTVPGSATTWSTTGAALGSDTFADISWTVTAAFVAAHPEILSYGLGVGSSVGPDDFAFGLSVINVGTSGPAVGSTVALNSGGPNNLLPSAAWRAEASFTGSSGNTPTPGAAALLGLGGLLAARRRRA